MKKKLILTISIVLVFALTMFIVMQNDEKVIYESGAQSIKTTDALAMMYETASGSGEYIVSNDTTWPTEGYIFNAELSRCENGSTLYWDEETQSVMMEANVSDKCYIYFDVYEPLLIISHSLGLGNGAGNYLGEVTTNREVEIEKYVLELDSGLILETTSDRWPDGCEAGYRNNTKYSYTFYIITVDGEVSEPVFGTLRTDNEICGPVIYP